MTNHDLLYLADLNYAESIRETARWRADSEIIERNDLLLIYGGDPTPVTNSVMRTGEHSGPPADVILDRVREYFGNRNLGYSLRLRRHLDSDLERLCQSAEMVKMAKISESPGMSIQEPIQAKDLPPGITVKSIEDKTGALDFASVAIDSYQSLGMPKEIGGKFSKRQRGCFDHPTISLSPI